MIRRNRGRAAGRARTGSFDWENVLVSGSALANAIVGDWALLPSAVRTEYTDPTLYATRLFARLNTRGAVGVSPPSAVAIGLIDWSAFDDSLPIFPGPITDGNLDWIVRYVEPLAPTMPTDGTIFSLVLDTTHLSKARRRLGAENGILVVFETSNIIGDFAADVRMLLRET